MKMMKQILLILVILFGVWGLGLLYSTFTPPKTTFPRSMGEAWAEEKPASKVLPVPTFYDLPREEVLEYRTLEAEVRAIRAESTLAVKELEIKRANIIEKWKVLVGGDLRGWQLDITNGKLILNRASGEE